MDQIISSLQQFWQYTGFANATWANLIMIAIGIGFITIAIWKGWEPLLLVPIGFGMIVGNIPMFPGLNVGIYEDGSVLNTLYQGVKQGWYPPLIFLGIGAMTDFSALISQPRLILIGAAAQFGIFGAYLLALLMGFAPNEAGAIGIIGGADGPTAIFLSSQLAPDLMGAIAVSAYSYMALVPVIQRPIMLALTTKKERLIKMPTPRKVSQKEKIIFPVIGFLTTAFIVPSGLPLLGMLFFGNLLKESGVTSRLARRCLDPGGQVPDRKVTPHLCARTAFLRHCNFLRSPVRQADERLHKEPEPQGQPADRKRRSFRRAGQRQGIRDCRKGVRYEEPPSHARYGTECRGRHRICSCSRYPAKLPEIAINTIKKEKPPEFPAVFLLLQDKKIIFKDVKTDNQNSS